MLKHIASAPTLSPASVRTAAPETPARTQVGLLGSTSVTVLGGSGQPRLSRASSTGKLASGATGGLSPAGLGPSHGVPRKSLVKNNSEPNLRRKKAVFADEPDDEHSYGQATKGTRYSANAPKARLSVAPKLMRGSTFEVYESEHKADFVVDKSFEKKAAGMATEGPQSGMPASTKIARGSMDSWTWMQQADVQERPGLKLKLQRQKITQFFDKNGSSKFPQLSLSLWVQAAARRAPDKLLIIQNTIPAATRRHNAEEAFEKDAEEAAIKKAAWEHIHTDIEVCQRKADCVYRPFQGTHKHFLPGGFDERNLATPRQEQTSEPNSPRSPLSEVSSATTNPLRGERRPTGDGCLRNVAVGAAGANRKVERSKTLPWSRAEEHASGLDWSSNPTQSDMPPPEHELCFYEHQHHPLEQLTLRLASRSSCSWCEELHRLETLKTHIHRHAAARMMWCMRLADTGPPAEGTRPDPVLPYHWAMQRLFDRVKEPLARKGYVRGTVAACAKDDWLRVLDHMCRQRFPGPASSIEEPLAMNLAYANSLPSPHDDTHMLHMLLEVRGMLLEPEVIHVLVVHAPLMNALYSLYARNNEGEMTEEEFLGFCKDFHLCPQLYSEHAVRSLYKSVDCRISVAKPAKPPEPEPVELKRGSRWGLAKNKTMIGVKMKTMFGIGRSSKESTVSRVSAAPSQASEMMRTSGAGSKLSADSQNASSTQTSLPGQTSPSRSPARDRTSQAGSSYTSQSQSGADKNRTQDMSASSLRGKRVRNQPAREPTPEPQAPEYYHLFGVHAFMEATLRLMFTYLSFYGNDAQMGMSSYCKVVWSFSYLHYAYSYHKQQIQRRRSKENKLTLEGMTEKVASNNPFAKATRAEFNALRSWLIKKCNSLDTAFETFDIDGSGQVTEQEFSKCLMVLEYTHDPELIGRLWRTFDFDLSGLISEREFMMIKNAVDEDAPTEPASPTSLPPDSPKPPVKRRSRWSAAVEEIVEFDKNYFFRHFPEHEDPPKNPDGRMNLVCGPKMLGGLDEKLFTEPPRPPVQLSFRAQMRAKETLGKSLDPLFKPDGTPIAQEEKKEEADEPLPVSIAELMALPGRGNRQRGPPDGPPALKVVEAPQQDHASAADTASVTSGAGRARGRLRTDSGDMPSPSRSRSKTRTQTEPARRYPDRESKGSPSRTSPSPGPTPKSRAPLSPKSGATPKSKPKRSPSKEGPPEPKLSDRQRCSLVDVRSIRAKALVWSPLKGIGWGGQPRTLIATGVNERYNQCCLEWADEKHTTVRCLCCARVHHADKSWGNPECCGCSVVDRMDLDAAPLAKLLGADIASAVGHAISAGMHDPGAMAGMAESDFAPSVGGDSLLGGASSAAFG